MEDMNTDHRATGHDTVKGLSMTAELMKNYKLLREYADGEGAELLAGCAILDTMHRSRRETQAVVQEIGDALAKIRAAAEIGRYAYKVDAFERHYLRGQTYEQIAADMNAGRNSPGRWCNEIMQQLAVHLFGVNGIGR